MLADFKINIHNVRKPMQVQVVVHETVQELRKAAQMFYSTWPKRDDEANDFMDTVGVCHRFHLHDEPVVALVRLAPPNISPDLVVHELAHAAIWVWLVQTMWDEKLRLTEANDEWFCWILGELVRHTTDKLYEHGIY